MSLLLAERPAARMTAPHGIVGSSAALAQALEMAARVARSNVDVLLRGESGTGKELFAKAIHELSARRRKPFVKVNCAALSESLLESELFGHEKGAFTGAVAARKGRFELADGGVLLLDEIGEVSPAFQGKLLRALSEGEFERVGGGETHRVDVRLIAATNRDLEADVLSGRFRADLYYRLAVVQIALPPLRERPEDIPLLADHILRQRFGDGATALSGDALDLISHCSFPGNVREFENCLRRAALAAAAEARICRRHFACARDECPSRLIEEARAAHEQASRVPDLEREEAAIGWPLSRARLPDRDTLIAAMEKTGWTQAKAARLLGVTPRQVRYALSRYGIAPRRL